MRQATDEHCSSIDPADESRQKGSRLDRRVPLEHERWNSDRVRDPDMGHFSPPAEEVNSRFAHREHLRGLPNAEKSGHGANFSSFSL
jgi:hypothetical protein